MLPLSPVNPPQDALLLTRCSAARDLQHLELSRLSPGNLFKYYSSTISMSKPPQPPEPPQPPQPSDRVQPPAAGSSRASTGGRSSSSSSPPVSPPYSSSPLVGTVISQESANQTTTSPSLDDSLIQPPSRTSPIEEQQPQLRYSVASHSVRITKHGYAIDPVELRYPEIINNISATARRASQVTFDGGNTGHKVLSLIRGFWSQPGFPRGKPYRNDRLNSINSILNEFGQYPMYPHEDTLGNMAKARPRAQPKRVKKIIGRTRQASSEQTNQSGTSGSLFSETTTTTSSTKPFSPPTLDSSARTSRGGSDILSLFISRQAKSPPAQAGAGLGGLSSDSRPPNRSANSFHSWIPKNKEQAYDLVTKLLQKMERIFSGETRIINISSPCTVLGDIHGNLIDLRTYERSLWPKAPNCLACNYLFLGDYVDRGEYSVECVLYLFAMKLLAPDRFFLLRGNHEIAAIQRQYTFGRECETKFGSYGRDIWLAFNKVFDLMPVAGVIDNQIFCAHGGIPRAVSDIKLLTEEIPSPLDNPEQQCPAAWEILWNDPITDSELIGMIEMDNAVPTTAIQMGQPSPPTMSPPQPRLILPAAARTITEPLQAPVAPTTTPPPATATATEDKKDESESSDVEDFETAMNRIPPAGISSYIRPDVTQSSTPTTRVVDEAKSIARASKEAVASSQAAPTQERGTSSNQDNQADRLRKVPSDTSSIASSSPQQIINDGFIANIKRGTAFLFSDQAVNNFLKLNKLSHVIRAHEVIPTGFAFHGEGRVITIFSSSKYCGLNNQAACALVEREKIRILRLDTGEAGE